MTWYITPENALCDVQLTETEGFVRCHFYHPNGTAIVVGKFDTTNYIEITKEVADIMRGV